MIQAIVFLPLLGFILAAAISLAGARGRHPGAEPPDDDHHAPVHGQTVHAGGGHAVIHETHHEPGGHDDHHAPAEPAAAGSRAAEIITTSFLMIAAVLAWITFWRVGFGHQDERIALFTWIISADLKVDWALRVDTLTAVMLVVVTTVSAFVHLYSIGYMVEEPYRPSSTSTRGATWRRIPTSRGSSPT
jgi:NADH-quinone oxidoreductase subunit L